MRTEATYAIDALILEKLHSGKWIAEPSTGNIYSKEQGRFLTPALNKDGYAMVDITPTHVPVARVIWIAAYGIPELTGLQIDHINEIKTDNRLENLRLLTPVGNMLHSLSRVTYEDMEQIRRDYAEKSLTQRELGKKYGIKQSSISRIVNAQKNKSLETELQDIPEEVRAGIFASVCCRGKTLRSAAKKYKVSSKVAIASVYDQSLKIERARVVNN